jgi:2-polyprenyl-3-methyl-5-hydroxy-6-metoxy-1,4-benzoquinol methylase
MKSLFYEQYYKKRLNKIVNIFGETWFQNKRILELGCAHGDIGMEFLRLGSEVVFSDERMEYLEDIDKRLKDLYNYSAGFALIDNDNDYDLNQKFDLVIHMGLLYHLQNWRNDITNALNHSNLMILESTVAANVAQNNTVLNLNDFDTVYGYCTKKNTRTYFTQEEVERELTNNGCKFLRLDDSELNVENQWLNNQKISFIYDWTYEKYISGCYEQMEGNVWFKRFWLVMK